MCCVCEEIFDCKKTEICLYTCYYLTGHYVEVYLMGDWKPDNDFLDFVLEYFYGAAADVPIIRMTNGHFSGRQVIEQMRAGQEHWKPTYDCWYEECKAEFDDYIAKKKP